MKNNKKEKIILANWKMRLDLAATRKLAREMVEKFKNFKGGSVGICPDFVSLLEVKKILKGSRLKLGAQDVFWAEAGEYTGEISPKVLNEAGCDYVFIGHSERREFLQENYKMIHKKLEAVLNLTKLTPVVCVGESGEERKANQCDLVLHEQMQEALSGIDVEENKKIIIAYEPIWAIGSGTAIEPTEAQHAHKVVKKILDDMFGAKKADNNFRIIYGGSANPKNAKDFVGRDNFDGFIVGTASLKADEFYKVACIITSN